jgi:hypothetical protein
MTEESTETAPVAEKAPEVVADTKPQTDWAAEAKKWEQRAKENKKAADELAALKASQMTEAERTTARLAELEREAQTARSEALRYRIATRFGINDDDAELFLTATDEATLERQAQALAARNAAAAEPVPARPRGDVDQGARAAFTHLNDGDGLDRAIREKVFGS